MRQVIQQNKNRGTISLALFIICFLFFTAHLPAQQKQVKYLSGTDNKNTVAWDFFCTGGRNSGRWTSIPVPSCWELQGFGNYNYGRDYKTYGKNFRFFDEQGMYKHSFLVPAGWKGKQIAIVFEGSMTDTEVKINGKAAGATHQGAFYEFKFNITDKLYFDKPNILEVTVSKMSADPSVNNAERLADYWIFGGIFRPVYLEAVPPAHIDYTAIDAKADGSFAMQVFPAGLKTNSSIVAEITDAKGTILATMQAGASTNDSLVMLQAKLQKVLPWSAETPVLYNVITYLKQAGKTIYHTTEKFGFRTIEIRKGEGIYLNGVQIKMKGINRHCIWPETGRTLNDAIQLMDVQLIKEMNMNAVRCSHYPPDKKFLQLCDSLGLYMLDELAGWQKAYSTKAGAPLVKELVLRDVNHPSIIFWDNGNEGGTNKTLDAEFYKYDFSQRPVIHPHHRPGNDFNGIDCNHYEDYYSTKKILADSLIYMPTEFLHCQDDGGGGAALADFWELHWNAKRSGGGFLWAMLDEGIVRTDMNGIIDVNGLNAPDGVLGPHREKEGSFNAIREIFSPVKIISVPLQTGQPLQIANRYHFTNLNQCHFVWQLVNYKKPADWSAGYGVIKTGTAAAPSIAPGATGILDLNLPSDYANYDAVLLAAYDPFKNLLYKWSWKIKTNTQQLQDVIALHDTALVNSTENDSLVTLKSAGISISFSKKDGSIAELRSSHGDKMSFGGAPVLVAGHAKFISLKYTKEADGDVVALTFEGDMKYARWKMFSGGWLSLEYEYTLNGVYPFAGISFTYPENYILGAKWLGKGPYRVWKNRLEGVTDNVWQNMNNNTQTGSAPWLFPEFKGYYAGISWMEMNTVEGKFLIASRDSGLYVRLFNFYGLSGVKPAPELPKGDISFLDAIPPIGTKLALNINYNTAALGPQSELNTITAPIKRTLYFYFGLQKTTAATQQFKAPVKDELF
ncbi:MAG: glycoside hydrolase family 2 TIM barrel-domain containing protein [Chitinophagaceae bacterium]